MISVAARLSGCLFLATALLAVPRPAAAVEPEPDVVVAAAGDVACAPGDRVTVWKCAQAATADTITAANPDAVLAIGDLQYPDGTLAEFTGGYDPAWGRFKSITFPAPGNHEWNSVNAQGYRDYFATGVPAPVSVDPTWYSFDLGAWHLVSLDSDCAYVGGCGASSVQGRWFRADLAAHDGRPTIVYWHHSIWASAGGQTNAMRSIWATAVADRDVQLGIGGHDHTYERFAPMGTAGPDPSGPRWFVAGAGGKSHGCGPGTRKPGSQVFDCSAFGALVLTLHADGSWNWRFAPVAGGTFRDDGFQPRR